MQTIEDFSLEQVLEYIKDNISALVIADENENKYRALVRRGIFLNELKESGEYADLVRTLWFHHHEDGHGITEKYDMFIPNMGKFTGKYSKMVKMLVDEIPHYVQMTVFPLEDSGRYIFLLEELDQNVKCDEDETDDKLNSIQDKIIVFTMTFDLANDTTSGIALNEVSEGTLNYQLKYSEWRNMIKDMIPEENRDLFLERSDPEYLRAHFKPGQADSFDVQMVNLDGILQWVKLIFSRMETKNENDYRFVYVVQNIHAETIKMQEMLKDYEERASTDQLTMVFNHARIETEMRNAIEDFKNKEKGTTAGLMILDIDHFKNVNDTYGHAVGDSTLVHLAETMKNTFTGRNAPVGRWGGEEFVVVLYGENEDSLFKNAELLRNAVKNEPFAGVGNITCSIGITMLRNEDTTESWFDRADRALYTAKSEGRNRVCRE